MIKRNLEAFKGEWGVFGREGEVGGLKRGVNSRGREKGLNTFF